jgi:hypothetical protein
LLAHAQIVPTDVTLQEVKTSVEAAYALIDGKADVAIIVASGEADALSLIKTRPDIHMDGIDKVASLVARESRLQPFVLPQGGIELRGDIPPRDVTMVATNLNLLVHDSMHPALQRALLDAAYTLHEMPSYLQHQGEFPNVRDVDFTLSPVARLHAAGERPLMEVLLPYRLAQLAELLIYAILPILVITALLLMWIPNFFTWKVNAVLQNHYGALKFLESEILPSATNKPLEIKRLMQRLDHMDKQIATLDLPDRYADRWYVLREHCAQAREKLLNLRAR